MPPLNQLVSHIGYGMAGCFGVERFGQEMGMKGKTMNQALGTIHS